MARALAGQATLAEVVQAAASAQDQVRPKGDIGTPKALITAAGSTAAKQEQTDPPGQNAEQVTSCRVAKEAVRGNAAEKRRLGSPLLAAQQWSRSRRTRQGRAPSGSRRDANET